MSQVIYLNNVKVLCQDCLRVKDFTNDRHSGAEKCECGGDLCGCPECVETLNALLAGKRKAGEIGCLVDIKEWSEGHGIGGNA